MKFQFIDNDSTQKPGARKAIRSHVMKGKNLGRTIQGRGKRHAAPQLNDLYKGPDQSKKDFGVEEGTKSLDGAVDNDGNALLFPEIADSDTDRDTDTTYSINNPYSGKEYTYFSFPVQFTPSMRYYVYECQFILAVHTAICNIIYPYAFCRPTDEIGSPWFRYMVADQACLHCLLAMAATYLNVLRNIPTPSLESIEATRHFSQALRLMNPRLSQPASAQKDSNIAIIISLAIHSNITQNLTASTMHLQGLENLLTFRPGGISDIRECNRALLHKICRTDIELAVAQGTRTRFGNAGLTAAAAGPISARNPPYPLNQMSELLRQITRELLALCRRPGKAKMSGLQYQDVLISMWQRLVDFAPLSGTRPQDLMDDGMYFTPEREFVEQAISFSQKQVDGKVEALAYKGNVIIVGRSSETSNLYSEEESSMDTLDMDWSVEDTTGFINVNAIRIAKYGERKIRDGEPLSKRK
ncbi:Argininosuccinate synthase [Fusarium odoratissimum]|uniref:Argininosuccinate synthase n=1 Tax=Fusarium oxysporum f. sp. cubense (strain race 4) TaxID=2502994 RepID=N1RK12_FUSC4|nr:Argininosuccinate synthase [Fusarium odoratissimum]